MKTDQAGAIEAKSEGAAKRPYRTPAVRVLGSLQDLTLGMGTSPTPDVASQPSKGGALPV